MITDPIADLLTRIRNAEKAKKEVVTLPYSKIKHEICQILVDEKCIKKVEKTGETKPELVVTLDLYKGFNLTLKRVSRPGQRIYKKYLDLKPVKSMMMQRSKDRELNWVICNFPTESLAQAANMTLQEYEQFISDACFLNEDDPTQKWRELSLQQETYVNRLNQSETIQFVSDHVDITFSTQGRIWINSDGKRNMPSGEVFTCVLFPL